MSVRRALAWSLAATAAIALSSCSSPSGDSTGRLQVVASTDVYASIVRAVAGSRVDITSFVNDTAQDPHSYEATARDQLAVSHADVLIENGGGYDDFMGRLSAASGKVGATTLDVVALSGHTAAPNGELNEHVWYDFPTVAKLVDRLVAVLSAKQPAGAKAFRAGGDRFLTALHGLEHTEATLRDRYRGTPVAITEPVPLYLLTACGLVDRTPAEFSAGVESGNDVSASVLQHMLDLFTEHEVRAIVYNAQTSGSETPRVLAAAHANGIPEVAVTETLPSGASYLSWMRANLAAVQRALSS